MKDVKHHVLRLMEQKPKVVDLAGVLPMHQGFLLNSEQASKSQRLNS